MARPCLFLAVALTTLPAVTGCGSDDCRKTLTCPVSDTGSGGGSATTAGGGGATATSGSAMGGGAGVGGQGGGGPAPIVERVYAGGSHTCATKSDGSLWCWGQNAGGQLGDGTGQRSDQPRAVSIPPLTSVTLSNAHSCAAAENGQTLCWGSNEFGQAGLDTLPGTTTPLAVQGLPSDFALRDTGPFANHTCGVSAGTGQAYCWGANRYGQLGIGVSGLGELETTPQLVGTGYRVVATGWFHTCAAKSDLSVECWGDGSVGALGSATNATEANPVQVPNITSAVDICSGGLYSCVLTDSGGVLCWGDLSGAGPSTPPLQVSGLAGVETIACGDAHACALLPDAGIRCWGGNYSGQLGTGSETPVSGLATPLGLPPVAHVAAGGNHSCAVTTDGAVYCWGQNDDGQLGTGTNVTTSTPSRVVTF